LSNVFTEAVEEFNSSLRVNEDDAATWGEETNESVSGGLYGTGLGTGWIYLGKLSTQIFKNLRIVCIQTMTQRRPPD